MRIPGSNATARVATPAAAKRAVAGGFAMAEEQAPAAAAPTPSLRTIGGIDALLALQGDGHPTERRRRAVTRGRHALDTLDSLKIELLAGTLGPASLARLKSASTDLLEGSGEAGLDAVLAEIELRVAVEIAKLSPR